MIEAPDVIAIDFEGFPIRQRPDYPPRAVGVSIRWPGYRSRYYAAGHPSGNNCTFEEAHAALKEAWASPLPKLFHHAKFDMAVAQEGLGLRELEPHEWHCTMILAFLYNPHARVLGLKELAEDLLDWPPEEQDAVKAWIWANRTHLRETYGLPITSSKQRDLGAYIGYVPGNIVKPYAEGDTDRTVGLWRYLYPRIVRDGMLQAYWREKRVQPIFMENERRGLRVDMAGLERDIEINTRHLHTVETWLRRELRASGLNFDADKDVANVLLQRGIVDPENWSKTPSGQLSMKKDVLTPDMFNDARVASALGYRNRLVTCVNTFMRPWHDQGMRAKGRIHATWNQVRNPKGGTRTGRPSCTEPNLLNLSKDFESEKRTAVDGYVHPAFLDVGHLPLVREYVLPEEGHVWLHRDFSGQELRVFADFEQGELYEAYQDDPDLDPHAFISEQVKRIAGYEYDRTIVKNINFGKIYGAGLDRIQSLLKSTRQEAKSFNEIHEKAMPGRKVISDAIKALVRNQDPIRTWGGRLYYVEPPKIIKGRRQTFEYKLLNYLIQGSAADITKQTMVDWHEGSDGGAKFLCQVYDELNISAPIEHESRYMLELKECMEKRRLDVPMRSDGKRGPAWGKLEKTK